jgi:hypothetical protein
LPLETAPDIDGVIDAAEWEFAEGGTGGYFRMEPNDEAEDDGLRGGEITNGDVPADAEDLSAVIFVGYDDENLYVAVRVTDFDIETDSAGEEEENGMTWQDDSVELFIDGDNSNWDTRDTTGSNPDVVDTGGQYVITANNAFRQAEAGDPGYGEDDAWYAFVEQTDTGYDAEFRVSLETIGDPQPGDIIGFSVAVNDDDDGGNAERQIMYSGLTHVESTYANLIIGTKSYSAPMAPAATIDGKIGTDEYPGSEPAVVTPFTGLYHLGSGDDFYSPDDHQFSFFITHDANAIYGAVDVTDDKIVNDNAAEGEEDGMTGQDDSVEIFFDGDDSNLLGRPADGDGQAFDGQYVYTANNAWRDNEANNPTYGEEEDWFAASTITEKGYIVEFRVNKSALPEIVNDVPIGFNICINDDDETTGNREAQLNWSGSPHSEFTYGSLTLSSDGVNALPFAISEVTYSPEPRKVAITWPSAEGESFTISRSFDLQAWEELDDGIAGAPGSTSYDDTALGEATHAYYQVAKEE